MHTKLLIIVGSLILLLFVAFALEQAGVVHAWWTTSSPTCRSFSTAGPGTIPRGQELTLQDAMAPKMIGRKVSFTYDFPVSRYFPLYKRGVVHAKVVIEERYSDFSLSTMRIDCDLKVSAFGLMSPAAFENYAKEQIEKLTGNQSPPSPPKQMRVTSNSTKASGACRVDIERGS